MSAKRVIKHSAKLSFSLISALFQLRESLLRYILSAIKGKFNNNKKENIQRTRKRIYILSNARRKE